jgi:hypothetical protein
MSDPSLDFPDRRRFLRQTATGMIAWASFELSSGAWEGAQAAEDSPNTHNMLVAGQESVFVSHLPMFDRLDKAKTGFASPHRYQVIADVSFTNGGKPVTDLYLKDRRAHPDVPVYTLGPQERFVLTRLAPVDSSPPRLSSFTATVFRGHLEQGGKPVPGLDKVVVTVNRIVHARRFDPRATKPPQLEYVLFGTPGDLMLAHAIFQPPDFDHVVTIAASGTPLAAKDLTGDMRIVFPDQKNVAADRVRESQKQKGMLRRASESGDGTPVELEVTRQLYFEEGELLIPPSFEPTLEEKKGDSTHNR